MAVLKMHPCHKGMLEGTACIERIGNGCSGLNKTMRSRHWWLSSPGIFAAASISQGILGAEVGGTNAPVLKYEEPTFLAGTIYASGRSRTNVLFKFKREATRTGNTLKVLREFSYPDGKLAVREHVEYQGDQLAAYELEELQIGASGSAKVRRQTDHPGKEMLVFSYGAAKGRPQTRTETLQKDTLIDDMVAPFLMDHWEALMKGQEARCRYIVVPRRETIGFKFTKQSEATKQGQKVVIIKMEPTSPIIAAMVDPLFFTIQKEGKRRILEYVGRTTPKVREGSKWKDLDAVTVFEWK